MQRILISLAILLLLTGCVAKPVPYEPLDPTPPTAENPIVPPPAPPGPEPDAPLCPAPRAGQLPIAVVSGLFQRSLIPAGEIVPGPGFYILDLSSGEIESWRSSRRELEESYYSLSPELHGWLIATTREFTYVLRQADGSAYCWPTGVLSLRAAAGDRVLVEGPKGTYTLLDERLQPIQTFVLASGQPTQALFSPDRRLIALNPWRWEAPPPDAPLFYVVDARDGSVTDVKTNAGAGVKDVILDMGSTAEIDLVTLSEDGRYLFHRFSWAGQLLQQLGVGGYAARSPDGRFLTRWQDLDGFSSAVALEDAATGAPLFRVLGAGRHFWLADSSGLLIRAEQTPPVIATVGGELRETQFPPLDGRYALYPSPVDPDQFLLADIMAGSDWDGLKVQNAAGQIRRGVPFGQEGLYLRAGWAPSGQAVLFSLWRAGGKGLGDGWFRLPLAVDYPPYSDPYFLQVNDPAGECVNLRTRPDTKSSVIRCLPTGTRLGIGDLNGWEQRLNSPMWGGSYWDGGDPWLWVRTPQGETGWVALYTDSITWAIEPWARNRCASGGVTSSGLLHREDYVALHPTHRRRARCYRPALHQSQGLQRPRHAAPKPPTRPSGSSSRLTESRCTTGHGDRVRRSS